MNKAFAGGLAVIAVLLVGDVRRSRACDRRRELRLQRGVVALCRAGDSIGYDGAYTGHDEPSLLFYSRAGLRELDHVPDDASRGVARHAEPGRHRRHLELPAASRVLVRDGALRQPVGAGVHARAVRAGQRHEHRGRHRPERRRLHRQAHGTAFLELQFYRRAGRLASGRQLRRHASGAPRWRSSA